MHDGLLIVDKSAGMTSHDVVGKCRRIVGQKRIGHTGTLDPGATGVLLVALGRTTRLIRFLDPLSKTYTCELVLGVATSTLDDEGEILQTQDMSAISLEEVQKAASKFQGDILQIPPMVSALKIDGKRLHELARQGIEVERKARPVTIHTLSLEEGPENSVFVLTATCSTGTYVRSLAADIGEALGGIAHLRNLRRTAIGPFDLARAKPLDVLESEWQSQVVGGAELLTHLAKFVVRDELMDDVAHGRKLQRAAVDAPGVGPWAVLDETGALLAVYEACNEQLLKAGVVLESR